MNRLGLPRRDLDRVAEDLIGVRLVLVMSHLARSEETDAPMNAAQRDAFADLLSRFPGVPASLANSSGIFLGSGFHFDLVRPGYAVYGGNPLPGRPSPMRQVVAMKARIVQVRDVDRGESVGYGATHCPTGPARIATVPIGYADGYRRSLGGRGRAYVEGRAVPVVGRVSMDLLTLDVSSLPARLVRPGTVVELIGSNATLDAVADAAGTIGYEILTGLGARVPRRYVRIPAGR
jgi:alanine racemase